MIYWLLAGLGLVAVALLAWRWSMRPSAELGRRFAAHPANAAVLAGLPAFVDLAGDASIRPRPMTAADRRRLQATLGQLEVSGPIYPLLPQAELAACVCLVGPSPALVHPGTGVLFGLRLGAYLPLLRLPDGVREEALRENAAWERCPLPALRDRDLSGSLGPEWVVPNVLHPAIDRYYRAALDHAAALDA